MGATVLDPLGGLAVSFFILQQGVGLSRTAFLELLDKGIDDDTREAIETSVDPLIDGEKLLSIRNVRGVKSGGGCSEQAGRPPGGARGV
jgi:divalent metal cation (Fe/Co/Zn/Cd) transporter